MFLGAKNIVYNQNSSATVNDALNALFTSFVGNDLGNIDLVDDASIILESDKSGFGMCNIGNNQEYCLFSFSTTDVILMQSSTNVVNTDTDGNLCIYYDGANLSIKNRLGSTLNLKYFVYGA